MPSAKGQTEEENFQRLDQQNKFLQWRMNVKNDFYVKIFRWRRRNDGVESGLKGWIFVDCGHLEIIYAYAQHPHAKLILS